MSPPPLACPTAPWEGGAPLDSFHPEGLEAEMTCWAWGRHPFKASKTEQRMRVWTWTAAGPGLGLKNRISGPKERNKSVPWSQKQPSGKGASVAPRKVEELGSDRAGQADKAPGSPLWGHSQLHNPSICILAWTAYQNRPYQTHNSSICPNTLPREVTEGIQPGLSNRGSQGVRVSQPSAVFGGWRSSMCPSHSISPCLPTSASAPPTWR